MATLSQSLIAPISGITELAAEKTCLIICVSSFSLALADLSGVLAEDPGDEVDVVDGAVVEDPPAYLQVVQGR